MTQLHAQPYDLAASGFNFDTAEEFQAKFKANINDYGDPVEEYEIQFIDGDDIDCDLATAWGLYQSNFQSFLEAADSWDDDDKQRYIIAVGECGCDHASVADNPSDCDIDIYPVSSMRELAEQFVDDGLFGHIPDNLAPYLDYDAIARDLAMDYTETTIAGESLIYRCA